MRISYGAQGLCGRCAKNRMLKGDLTVDAMLLHGHQCKSGAFMGGAGAIEQSRLTIRIPLCGHCYRILTAKGAPQVHLVSRGVEPRLTRKQALTAARKRVRAGRLLQDLRETEGGE